MHNSNLSEEEWQEKYSSSDPADRPKNDPAGVDVSSSEARDRCSFYFTGGNDTLIGGADSPLNEIYGDARITSDSCSRAAGSPLVPGLAMDTNYSD
jgi:hypothetical protein